MMKVFNPIVLEMTYLFWKSVSGYGCCCQFWWWRRAFIWRRRRVWRVWFNWTIGAVCIRSTSKSHQSWCCIVVIRNRTGRSIHAAAVWLYSISGNNSTDEVVIYSSNLWFARHACCLALWWRYSYPRYVLTGKLNRLLSSARIQASAPKTHHLSKNCPFSADESGLLKFRFFRTFWLRITGLSSTVHARTKARRMVVDW